MLSEKLSECNTILIGSNTDTTLNMEMKDLKVGDVFTFDKYPNTGKCKVTAVLRADDMVIFQEEGKDIPESCPMIFDVTLVEDTDKVNSFMEGDYTFEQLGASVGNLVAEKQRSYGDSFGRSGECLRQMFPDGIEPEQYDDLLTIARILDKLFRIANNKDAFEENPWRDLAGYSLLSMKRYDKE